VALDEGVGRKKWRVSRSPSRAAISTRADVRTLPGAESTRPRRRALHDRKRAGVIDGKTTMIAHIGYPTESFKAR
jgi:hypothetical protein